MKLIIVVCCVLLMFGIAVTSGQSPSSESTLLDSFQVHMCKETGNCKRDWTSYYGGKIPEAGFTGNLPFYNLPPEEQVKPEENDEIIYRVGSRYPLNGDGGGNRLKNRRLFRGERTTTTMKNNNLAKTDNNGIIPNEGVQTLYPSISNWQAKRSNTFSSWGGKKRVPMYRATRLSYRQRAIDDGATSKRENMFPTNNWGGGSGDKGSSKFYSWGGKRSISDEDLLEEYMRQQNQQQPMIDDNNNEEFTTYDHDDDGSHRIQRRDAAMAVSGGKSSVDDAIYQLQREQEISSSNNGSPKESGTKLSSTLEQNANLAGLFTEFLNNWSKKRPEQKKATNSVIYHRRNNNGMKMLRSLSSDKANRRGSEFFSWGGKRNSYYPM